MQKQLEFSISRFKAKGKGFPISFGIIS